MSFASNDPLKGLKNQAMHQLSQNKSSHSLPWIWNVSPDVTKYPGKEKSCSGFRVDGTSYPNLYGLDGPPSKKDFLGCHCHLL